MIRRLWWTVRGLLARRASTHEKVIVLPYSRVRLEPSRVRRRRRYG